MKRKCLLELLSFSSVWLVLIYSSWAGEVVTKDLRTWAQKMIQEEKAIKAPPAQNTLAVPYFQNKTGQADLNPLQKGIAIMLTTDLSKLKEFQVLERVRLQALVEELGLGVSGLVEPNTAPRVGKLLGAHWLIGGNLGKGKGEQIQIQSNPLDVTTQNILGQPITEGLLTELFRMEKDLLFEIIKLLKIEVTPEEEKELRKPCSISHKALMALFKGIDASDRGNYEKAAQFYELALKEDPNICEASEALQELKTLGLMAGKGRGRILLRSIKDRTSLTDQLTPEDATKRTSTPDRQPSRIPQ
jgi:TolB-like protein